MSNYRYLKVTATGQTAAVRITEPVLCGDSTAEVFLLELKQLVDQFQPKNLVLDFQDVKMLSSTVISALLKLNQYVSSRACSLVLCRLPGAIRDVIRTLRLDGTVFTISDSWEEVFEEWQVVPQRRLAPNGF
jgi:anti-anti-sigma factor